MKTPLAGVILAIYRVGRLRLFTVSRAVAGLTIGVGIRGAGAGLRAGIFDHTVIIHWFGGFSHRALFVIHGHISYVPGR